MSVRNRRHLQAFYSVAIRAVITLVLVFASSAMAEAKVQLVASQDLTFEPSISSNGHLRLPAGTHKAKRVMNFRERDYPIVEVESFIPSQYDGDPVPCPIKAAVLVDPMTGEIMSTAFYVSQTNGGRWCQLTASFALAARGDESFSVHLVEKTLSN